MDADAMREKYCVIYMEAFLINKMPTFLNFLGGGQIKIKTTCSLLNVMKE